MSSFIDDGATYNNLVKLYKEVAEKYRYNNTVCVYSLNTKQLEYLRSKGYNA